MTITLKVVGKIEEYSRVEIVIDGEVKGELKLKDEEVPKVAHLLLGNYTMQ